jgi:hypothetical protein
MPKETAWLLAFVAGLLGSNASFAIAIGFWPAFAVDPQADSEVIHLAVKFRSR